MQIKKMTPLWLAAALALPGGAMCAEALQPYAADYSFKMKGLKLTAKQTLVAGADGKWLYSFNASALRIGQVAEYSTVNIGDGTIKTLDHSRSFKILMKSKKLSHVFDGKNISINNNGSKTSVPQKDPVYDANSVLLQVRLDLMNKALRPTYRLIDKAEVEEVPFVNRGNETITVHGQQYVTTKIERIHSNKNRKTVFWLGNKQAYVPIKVEHIDDGEGYSVELKGLKFNPL